MPTIEKLEINGFKAFPQRFELNFDGKHLLLYGENGSGKSSIYYALHCLFQSPFKQDGGKKYFDINNPQNLINKDSAGDVNYIKLSMSSYPILFKVDKNGYNVGLLDGVVPIPCNLYNNVFVNHKFISNFFLSRNSEEINLFPVFYKDIFPYILVRDGKQILGDIYDSIIQNPSRRKEYKNDIEALNIETKYWIGNMNLNISNIYNESFRKQDDCKLKITLIFQEQPQIIDGETIYYWGRYDYRTYKEIVANKPIIKKAKYKSYIEPHIGLSIEEVMSDGSSRQIEKPQTYFNEAKLTAIALAIRFSILDTVSDANGRFMALDDMLISLDMSNRTKVINYLLNSVSNKYKIYLFTHDKVFFEHFKEQIIYFNKAEGLNEYTGWLIKELYNDDNSQSNPRLIDSESDIAKALIHYKNFDYPASANYLRKATETLVQDILPDKLLRQDCGDKHEKLRNILDASFAFFQKIPSFDLTDLSRLIGNLNLLLNPLSHKSTETNVYKTELKEIFEILERLKTQILDLRLKEILPRGEKVYMYLLEDEHKTLKYELELKTELYTYEIEGKKQIYQPNAKSLQSCIITDGIQGEYTKNRHYQGSIEKICQDIHSYKNKECIGDYISFYKNKEDIPLLSII